MVISIIHELLSSWEFFCCNLQRGSGTPFCEIFPQLCSGMTSWIYSFVFGVLESTFSTVLQLFNSIRFAGSCCKWREGRNFYCYEKVRLWYVPAYVLELSVCICGIVKTIGSAVVKLLYPFGLVFGELNFGMQQISSLLPYGSRVPLPAYPNNWIPLSVQYTHIDTKIQELARFSGSRTRTLLLCILRSDNGQYMCIHVNTVPGNCHCFHYHRISNVLPKAFTFPMNYHIILSGKLDWESPKG